jgi:hypothetical protein
VWATDEEMIVPPGCRFLGGRQRAFSDGTPVGTTYLAIYERAAIEPLWRSAPRGFAIHERYMLSRSVQASLSARGWRYRWLDTGRLLNLQLLLEGLALEHRAVRELHHVGGFSLELLGRPEQNLRSMLGGLYEILRSQDGHRLQRVVDGSAHALYLHRRQRDAGERRMRERRRIIVSHLEAVLDAIVAGEPVPPSPSTDSAEVDRRVASFVSALERHYREGAFMLRPATGSPAFRQQ